MGRLRSTPLCDPLLGKGSYQVEVLTGNVSVPTPGSPGGEVKFDLKVRHPPFGHKGVGGRAARAVGPRLASTPGLVRAGR
jgi:hypothetical protein